MRVPCGHHPHAWPKPNRVASERSFTHATPLEVSPSLLVRQADGSTRLTPDAIRRTALVLWLSLASISANAFGEESQTQASSTTQTIRVLILSGQGSHDWGITTPVLRQTLADTGRFDVRVCEIPVALSAETLARFDVVIDNCGGSGWGNATEAAVEAFVKGGKGLVAVHAAVQGSAAEESHSGASAQAGESALPRHWKLLKVASMVMTDAPHSADRFLEIKLDLANHPIVQGIANGLRIADRLQESLTLTPGAEVVASAREIGETAATSRSEPVLFTSTYGRGRVFCTALGHDAAAMRETAFKATFARGTEWAASGKVTLAPDLSPPGLSPKPVRGMVITGGHDHETAFYSLFDGYKDLARMNVSSSASAFQSDLRDRCDVLIMYDFSRDLDEKGKKNLHAFVESGKGIVVLHHAILSYQKWPWWFEEVVGGRYRLDSEGSIPAASATEGQELFVTPAEGHPITAGIGPFHLVDEPYKGMWISSRIKPLLITDHPKSDHAVAWIGPCAKSRVVYIQLGHDHVAFAHPGYRALVHNAILWSAGRLD